MTERQAVLARLLNQLARDAIRNSSRAKRRERLAFHANERRMIERRDRLRAGADERQLVDVEVHRHVELAVGAFRAGDQEHRLQVEQLPIERQGFVADVVRVDVGHVAAGIGVAGFPEPLAVGPDEHDVAPTVAAERRARR